MISGNAFDLGENEAQRYILQRTIGRKCYVCVCGDMTGNVVNMYSSMNLKI